MRHLTKKQPQIGCESPPQQLRALIGVPASQLTKERGQSRQAAAPIASPFVVWRIPAPLAGKSPTAASRPEPPVRSPDTGSAGRACLIDAPIIGRRRHPGRRPPSRESAAPPLIDRSIDHSTHGRPNNDVDRALWEPAARSGERRQLGVAEALPRVVVHEARGLHERVTRGRADEAEAAALQILRHRR